MYSQPILAIERSPLFATRRRAFLLGAVGQMEAGAVDGAHFLQARGAGLAHSLVALQRARHVAGHRLQE